MACESVNDVLMVSYSYCERQKYSPDVIKKDKLPKTQAKPFKFNPFASEN